MLIPQVAAGAAAELTDVRQACDEATDQLLRVPLDVLAIVGPADTTAHHAPPWCGSLAPFGLPMRVCLLTPGEAAATSNAGPGGDLPLSVTIGAWLVERAAAGGAALPPRVRVATIAFAATVGQCRELAAQLVGDGRTGLLVIGDGTACRGEKSPGYADPRAEPFDAMVAAALGAADTAALLDLDAGLAGALKVAGRPAWQVLAAAADAGEGPRPASKITYQAAPYGVAYFVATWLPV
jgi:hypothetical protein